MLEKRRQSIAQGLEDARVAAEARANAEKEAEKIIADANRQAGQIVAEAKDRAEVAARDVRASAEAEAVKPVKKLWLKLKKSATGSLAICAVRLLGFPSPLPRNLVGEALDEKRQHALSG